MKACLHPIWTLVCLALLLALAGCATLPAAAPASQPTPDFEALHTEIAKYVSLNLTLEAALTQIPSATPLPATPAVIVSVEQPTPTLPTATIVTVIPIATSKPSSGGGTFKPTPTSSYTDQARVVSQSPKDYTFLKPGQDFDAKWVIKNTGKRAWNSSFYYRHDGGLSGALTNRYFIPRYPAVGETVELVVDMVAPNEPGHYTTYWELVNDDGTAFFRFYLVFNVAE
ncbi:MAG: NBR1-Ig-like domain-containing protein [Anaerolineaceae bacterium]|nr:NBR1-Ig-like domain-containing protein [Anaerolineaceae bacterium]